MTEKKRPTEWVVICDPKTGFEVQRWLDDPEQHCYGQQVQATSEMCGGCEGCMEAQAVHYGMKVERRPRLPVYLHLFHGRKDPEEILDAWGEDGPWFGPFDFVHNTYHSDLKFSNDEVGKGPAELKIVENLAYYDGMYYGDWSVCADLPAGPVAVLPEAAKADRDAAEAAKARQRILDESNEGYSELRAKEVNDGQVP